MIEITEDQNVIVNGNLYETVDTVAGVCSGCAFDGTAVCGEGPCEPYERVDERAVIFVKSTALAKPSPVLASTLTLRDHFAGQALAGFFANTAVFAEDRAAGWSLVNCTEEQLAQHCYRMADVMMKARGK